MLLCSRMCEKMFSSVYKQSFSSCLGFRYAPVIERPVQAGEVVAPASHWCSYVQLCGWLSLSVHDVHAVCVFRRRRQRASARSRRASVRLPQLFFHSIPQRLGCFQNEVGTAALFVEPPQNKPETGRPQVATMLTAKTTYPDLFIATSSSPTVA